VCGDLAVDYARHRARVGTRAPSLTAKEFDLLRILSLNAGRVVATETILRQLWGSRNPDDSGRLRTVVKKLRAKLGDSAVSPLYIFTERGVGYRLAGPEGG